MKAFRGYFDLKDVLTSVEEGIAARITMFFDESTGIHAITNDELRMTNKVYDLQGRMASEFGIRNSELKKGLYIINGQKVLVK